MVGTRIRRRKPAPVSEALRGLGERLRRARLDAGLSQAQLGEPHFTRAYVSAIELGKVRPSMKSLEFIATKLGRPASFFIEDEAEEQRRKGRALDVSAASALLSRNTAANALARIEALLTDASAPREISQLRFMAGTALNFLMRGPEAVTHLVAAEKTALQLNDDGLLRRTRHQLALAHRNSGDRRRALEILQTLLGRLDTLVPPDRVLQMKVLKDLGAVSFDLGEAEAAAAYLNAALVWANEIGDLSGLIAIYNGLAYTYRARGDLDAATVYLQRALGATEAANDMVQAAIVHNSLAVISAERGHLQVAVGHADRAIEIARATGPAAYLASILSTKAECLLKLGDLPGAERWAASALQLALDHSASGAAASAAAAAARLVLAEVAARSGAIDKSRHQLEEAAATYRATGARQELGEVLMRLSRLAHAHGDEAAAQRFAAEAFQSAKSASHLLERRVT